jgi:hypothetical protein
MMTISKSPEPLALAVPLSRFTLRVGGGSDLFVGGSRTLKIQSK